MSTLPMGFVAVGAALFLLVLLRFIQGIYHVFFHPLAKIPGPKLYAYTDLFYIYYISTGGWNRKLKELHDTYGPVVRFGPSDVSFIKPGAWKQIYGHKRAGERSYDKDKRVYRDQTTTTTIITSNDADHKRMRRLLSHAFSEKALRDQEDIIRHYIDLLISKLTKLSEKREVIDIVSWYNFTTFDLIGDLAFGQPFGCLESGGYHPWVAMIFDSVRHSTFTQISKRMPVLKPLLTRLVPKNVVHNMQEHRKLSEITVMRRIQDENTTRNDFMTAILRHNDEKGMSVPEIIETANALIIAGSETTATQLSGTTFNLLTNRNAYDKLVKEIRSTFSSDDEITMTSVNDLRYMMATLEEGFRMYPPVPVGLPRLVPKGGAIIEGYLVPEKTSVSVPQWVSYRSAQNFVDPDSFRPERWLGDARYASDEREVLNPFSIGPRNCIGKNLAYAEMRVILARVLWNFDLEIMPECNNWTEQNVFLLWNKGPLKVKLSPVQRGSQK